METFYDKWLGYWDEELEAKKKARKSIHEEELEWVRTRQDYRAALLASPETGFFTMGSMSMVAEIPPGWKTGMHSHGEEAIFILNGKGYSVIGGQKYDWEKYASLFMPFGVPHQHYNTGDETARYLSAMEVPLEKYVGLAKFVQYEDCSQAPLFFGRLGETEPLPEVPAGTDIHPEYGRILLHYKDAPRRGNNVMIDDPKLGWKWTEARMTILFIDAPRTARGTIHGHMEAQLYVIQGSGYSIVGGEKVPWKNGTLYQVQGPQTPHQHFNTGDMEAHRMRIEFGMRRIYFFPIAKKVFPYLWFTKPDAPTITL